jgi:outer membrane protein
MHSMTFRRPLTALALALGLAAGSGAQAQSLKDLYEAARTFDATYLAARSLADSAQYKAAQAEALTRPSAAFNASAVASQLQVPRISPATGVSNGNITGESNTVKGSIDARYPLYNRSNDATIDQARKALLVSQADLEAAEQDLIVRVTQAYFDALAAQDTLRLTRTNKAAIAEQLASAKRNFEVGTATITDTREAQAKFDLAGAQEIAADNDLRNKRIALAYLVGRSEIVPKPLAAPVLLPPVLPLDVEAWVNVGDGIHPSVRKAQLALDVALLETAKARAGEKPTVDAVASIGRSDASGRLASLGGISTTGSLGVQLSWPLYTGGATQNRIKETLALEDKSRNDLEGARRGVGQGTRVAFWGVVSGEAQVKALEAAESSSKLALEATQLGYKVGVRVNLDVLNAQTQLFQTQRDLAKARYDVLVGGLKLRQASGQLTAGDIEPVERLLVK